MLDELESQYPIGSDITIMNTYYSYPKFEDGKKVMDDFLYIIYKDNTTKKKHYKIIMKPKYTFYVLKDEADRTSYNRLFIEKEKVIPVTVPFNDLEKEIAKRTGNEEFYKQNILNRNKRGNKQLHFLPDIFFSDVDIEDHYRFKFANSYTNEIKKLQKGFFDIEVDGKWAKGDFVELGECAINCVSFYDDGTDKVYTFILRDERNPLIQEFEDEINSGKFGFNEMHKFIIDSVGGKKQASKYGLLNTTFEIYFYDSEIELIKDLFKTFHICSPDFIEGWNSSAFDLSYIIARIYVLGYEPEDIMCDPNFPVKVVRNYVDERHLSELAERGDYTFISGLPVFIDQMIQYASRRKSKIGSYKSTKLDDIGELEAGVKKLDYSHITHFVTELPWLAFKTFVLYNIMDVIVQKCIETKTNDLEYIFSKCIVNNTVYKRGHRQTVYLINRMAADWYKMGYIIGNNNNRENPKPPKYLGALVGKPLNTNGYSKMKIDGRDIWLCENCDDYDFKSLYPSIMGELNIAPNTQIGKVDIPNKVYKDENAYNIEETKYSRGGEFIENLVTDNILEYCSRWFNLPDISEMINYTDEYYSQFCQYKVSSINTSGMYGNPVVPIIPTTKEPHKAIRFNQPKVIQPIFFYNNRDPKYTYNNLKEEGK